jgi:hypothetical protein
MNQSGKFGNFFVKKVYTRFILIHKFLKIKSKQYQHNKRKENHGPFFAYLSFFKNYLALNLGGGLLMGKRKMVFAIVFFIGILFSTSVCRSESLYDNGLFTNEPFNGFAISYGYIVSNSFTLAGYSTLSEVEIGLWTWNGYSPVSVEWSISTNKHGNNPSLSGISSFTDSKFISYKTINDGSDYGTTYDLYTSTFFLNGTLNPGRYWLTLQNAVSTNSEYGEGPVFWDESDGPSKAWCDELKKVGSESFQIYGRVPEPMTILFLGTGLVSLLGIKRKIRN